MQRMQDTGRLNANEEKLRNLLILGLAGDAAAYPAFLRELSAHLRADAAQRAVLFFGDTWNSCPLLIAMLSVPVLAALVWAMQRAGPDETAACRGRCGAALWSGRHTGV